MIRRHREQATCESRDQELLLYIHGELPPMARSRTVRHLRGCPTCQQRATALLAASGAFAEAVRGDSLPAWRPSTGTGWIPAAPAIPLAIIALLTLTTISATVWMRHGQASVAPAASTSPNVPIDDFIPCHQEQTETMPSVQPSTIPTPSPIFCESPQSKKMLPLTSAPPKTSSPSEVPKASCELEGLQFKAQ
jgi:hypothetical protein